MAGYPDSIERRVANAPSDYANSARHLLPAAADLHLAPPTHQPLYERVLNAMLDLAAGDWEKLRDLSTAAKSDWRDILLWAEESGRFDRW